MGSRLQRGVTLIELLVSITIVGLLAATALIAWRVSVSAWERAEARLEHDRGVLAVHQLVAEQIASMTPYQVQLQQRGRLLFFQGEPETARFVSRYSLTHRAASGLYMVEYHVVEQRNGSLEGAKQLLLQETPLSWTGQVAATVAGIDNESGILRMRFVPFEAGPAIVVLAEGLAECRFEYYIPAANRQPGGWVDRVAELGSELPRAIRIQMAARESANLEPVTIAATIRNFARPVPRVGLSVPQ
jgi:prepilin-type N-terminal cleavage/methylation domain-containing protein